MFALEDSVVTGQLETGLELRKQKTEATGDLRSEKNSNGCRRLTRRPVPCSPSTADMPTVGTEMLSLPSKPGLSAVGARLQQGACHTQTSLVRSTTLQGSPLLKTPGQPPL